MARFDTVPARQSAPVYLALDERDPGWLRYRARALMEVMRGLRRLLDEAARRRSRRRLEISAWVFSSEDENLFYGLDLKAWLREGLVDTLIPYTSAPKLFSWATAWENPADVEAWLALVRGTSCRLALNLMPRNMDGEQYLRKAHALYPLGIEHLAFWDTPIVGSPASPCCDGSAMPKRSQRGCAAGDRPCRTFRRLPCGGSKPGI